MNWTLLPISQWAAHAARWDALQARSLDLPFLESAFLEPLLAEFGRGDEWLAYAQDGGAGPDAPWQAAALLQRDGLGRWSSFQPSQLPLGPVLLAPGQALEPAFQDLLRQLPGLGLTLGLTQLDSALLPRPADGARCRGQHYIATAWVDLQGDFDSYWEARGKNLRQNTRKQLKKVEAQGYAVQMDCLTEPGQMAQALAHYGRLEAAGWKAGEGTAIAPDNDQGRFYLAMLQRFAALGRARVYQYRFNDDVVAMDLCIESGSALVILKTAYDPAHHAVSPSTLMRQQQFQALFQQPGTLRRIEFYGRVMEWHTRWTEQQRELYHLSLYRWAALRQLHERLRKPGPDGNAAPAGDGGTGTPPPREAQA